MLWHALPPEVNTTRLMTGAGPAPMMQAAAGWQALATALDTQAAELAAVLAALGAAWTGTSGERAIAATVPMVTWLQTVAVQARKRGLQAAAQAAAYSAALAATPSLPEIAANHVTRAVLVATNFLGINTVPIGLKETDYFVRMWNQAAAAMDAYQAETAMNSIFEPLPPLKPIVLPEASLAAEAGTVATVAQLATKAADSKVLAALAETPAETGVGQPYDQAAVAQQLMPMLGQLGQLTGPVQQLTQLFQSAGGMGGGLGGELGELAEGEAVPPLGLLGATPVSTHPLAGGSGPSVGAGLVRAASLPGLGASQPRTALLGQLLDKSVSVAPAGAAPGAAAGAGSSGLGGAAPLGGMAGHAAQSGVARSMTAVPALAPHPADDEPEHLGDGEDDW